MKTRASRFVKSLGLALLVWSIFQCQRALAYSTEEQITPKNYESFFDIESRAKADGRIEFEVAAKFFDNGEGKLPYTSLSGSLFLWDGEKFVASSDVNNARPRGPAEWEKKQIPIVFTFTVSKELLAASKFEVTHHGDTSQHGYWFYLRDFAPKESNTNGEASRATGRNGSVHVTPEYFNLEVQLGADAATNSTFRFTVGTEQPFSFDTVVGESTNSISGVLHSATNGAFPLNFRVRWKVDSRIFDSASEWALELGKPKGEGHVGAGGILSEGFTLKSSAVLPTEHVVQPSETLASIARTYYGDERLAEGYRAMVAANPQVKPPHLVSRMQIIIPKLP